jgi:hypothetical protein
MARTVVNKLWKNVRRNNWGEPENRVGETPRGLSASSGPTSQAPGVATRILRKSRGPKLLTLVGGVPEGKASDRRGGYFGNLHDRMIRPASGECSGSRSASLRPS